MPDVSKIILVARTQPKDACWGHDACQTNNELNPAAQWAQQGTGQVETFFLHETALEIDSAAVGALGK
jgi:hypothetical protein